MSREKESGRSLALSEDVVSISAVTERQKGNHKRRNQDSACMFYGKLQTRRSHYLDVPEELRWIACLRKSPMPGGDWMIVVAPRSSWRSLDHWTSPQELGPRVTPLRDQPRQFPFPQCWAADGVLEWSAR